MLEISTIKNGIVIDHIEPGFGYRIFKLLNLHEADFTVAFIKNVVSQKSGRKDMIKIENEIDMDLDLLGLFGDGITVNIIRNETIVRKSKLTLPQTVERVLECKNPRCISNNERNMMTRFNLMSAGEKKYTCDYCDHILKVEEIK